MVDGSDTVKLLFLGTGTSVGIPAIGCTCPVCVSDDPHNKRLRPSVYLQGAGKSVIVDTTPDFRMQALTHEISSVDAILLTHSHADHILGFDDIRRFNTIQECVMPVYGLPETIRDMERIFDYVHKEHVPGVYRPRVTYHEVEEPFDIDGIHVEPLEVDHGPKRTCGFLFRIEGRELAYVPDCSKMPAPVLERVKGIDVVILDALRHRPHRTHMTLATTVKALEAIGAGRSYVTHMCHDLDHDETQASLPDGMFVAYDGLEIEW